MLYNYFYWIVSSKIWRFFELHAGLVILLVYFCKSWELWRLSKRVVFQELIMGAFLCVWQWLKVTLGAHMKYLGWSHACISDPVCCYCGRQGMMTLVFRPLPPMWEILNEFYILVFSLGNLAVVDIWGGNQYAEYTPTYIAVSFYLSLCFHLHLPHLSKSAL